MGRLGRCLVLLACIVVLGSALPRPPDIHHQLGVASEKCGDGRVSIVESMPIDLNITKAGGSIYENWIDLIKSAKKSLDIAGMYMTLTQGTDWPKSAGGYMGLDVFNAIVAAQKRGVRVRFVQDPEWARDPATLAALGVDVRNILWPKLTNGSGGVLHTKFMIVDAGHLYLGSANWDWRSLSQIKELGIVGGIL